MRGVLVGALTAVAALLAIPRPARLRPPIFGSRDLTAPIQVLAAASGAMLLVQFNMPLLVVIVVLGLAAAVGRAVRRRRTRQVTQRRQERVLAACEGLAADLGAGLPPTRALAGMAEDCPDLRPVADAGAVGADVSAAFRKVSGLPGAEMLRVTAAAWSVAHRSGAGLADAVGLASETMRAERATARTVAAELAAAMATARLLSALPIGILIIGRGTGGDPFGFLLGSLVGQVCLSVGLGLTWTGTVWLERIVDQVEQT